MKLYLLFGLFDEFKYFYGVFSSEFEAEQAKQTLESDTDWPHEEITIEEHILDEPTDLYYYMLE